MKVTWCLEMCDFQITVNYIHCYWSDINKMEDNVLQCFKQELSLKKTASDEIRKEIRSKAAEIIFTMIKQIPEDDMYGKTANGRDVKQPESPPDSNHYDVYDSGTGTVGSLYRQESNFPQDRHENPQDQKNAAEEGPELPLRKYNNNNQGPKLPPKRYENCNNIRPENSLVQKDAIEKCRRLQPSEHSETDEGGYESLCGKSQLVPPPPEMHTSEVGPKLPPRKHGNNHPIRRESLKVYSDEGIYKDPGRRSVFSQTDMHTSEAGPKLPHGNNYSIRRESLKVYSDEDTYKVVTDCLQVCNGVVEEDPKLLRVKHYENTKQGYGPLLKPAPEHPTSPSEDEMVETKGPTSTNRI